MKRISDMTEMELRQIISSALGNAANQDIYVTGKELCKQLQMFTPSWLKANGHLLPRTCATLIKDGNDKPTHYAYNITEIRKMIDEDRLVFTFKEKVAYKPSKHGKTA